MLKRNKLVSLPVKLVVHQDFYRDKTKEEFEIIFREVWNLFHRMYTDAKENPADFGVASNSKKIKNERIANNYIGFAELMYEMLENGDMSDGNITVTNKNIIKQYKKALNTMMPVLIKHGFHFDGLDNRKVTSKVSSITIGYPSKPSIMGTLYLVAKQASSLKPETNISKVVYYNGDYFAKWDYRLLIGPIGSLKTSMCM